MARTRSDPWQADQPAELLWWDSALSSILHESPKFSSPSPLSHSPPPPSPPSPPYEETSSYSMSSTKYLTKPSANIISFLSKSKSIPPPPSNSKPTPPSKPNAKSANSKKPNHLSKSASSKFPLLSSESELTPPKLKKPNPYFLPYSESKEKHRKSVKSKTSTQHRGKVSKPKPKSRIDLETAALKALNDSFESGSLPSLPDIDTKPSKPLKNSLELPDGDPRKNMIPKIILRDIGGIICKVCPKLSSDSTPPSNSPSAIAILPPTIPLSGQSTPVCGRMISPARLSTPESPKPPVLSPVSPLKCPVSPFLHGKEGMPGSTLNDIPTIEPDVPQIFLDPPVVTLEEKPPVLMVNGTSSMLEKPPTHTVSGISLITRPPFTRSTSGSPRKSPLSSEKSSAPVSKKSIIYEALEAIAPTLKKLERLPSSSIPPCSSKSIPSYPIESISSLSTKPDSQLNHLEAECPKPAVTRSLRSSTTLSEPALSSGDTLNGELSNLNPEMLRLSDENLSKLKSVVIKNGFLGFPKEDGKRLIKTRFHVDTNILASSLDLLDLQKHSGTSTGSPTTCCHCNIIFSSVKHCKYHQSVTCADVIDLTCPETIQEDGFCLCPWCPVMCTTVEFLNKHKLVCREKGRCQEEEKASSSSQRKSAQNSSRRRTAGPAILSSSTATMPALGRPSNSYKVVHGIVLPPS